MDRSDVARLYKALKTNYGAAFTRSFPTDVIEEWYGELRHFTNQQGAAGIARWVGNNPERYPNLPQLAREIRGMDETRSRVVVEDGPVPGSAAWLRNREASRKVGLKFVEKVKAAANGNSEYTRSSADQRKRAMQALKTKGPEGTARAHRILTEHLQPQVDF